MAHSLAGSRLCTGAVAERDQLAYWIDAICDTYVQLDCDARAERGFRGTIRRHQLAHLDLSVVSSQAQRVMRTPRQIGRSSEDYFLVSIQARGRGIVRQDGREARLDPGDFALYDSTRPYDLEFGDEFEQIVLMLPGDPLRSQVRDTEELTATAVSGREGAGHLLIDMIATLRQDIDRMQPGSAAAVADGVLHILAAGLRTLPAAQRQRPSDLTAYHLQRIKARVRDRLCDPTLSIATLATELGLSVGHVHRLFLNEPQPLGHYIRAQRLAACHRDLADPRLAARSISDIAFGWGFNDTAHFSRVFREHFGISARDWRQQTLGGARPAVR